MNIGKSITVALEGKKENTSWLARQMGVSRTRAGVLKNSRGCQTNTIKRLAEIFGMKESEFIALGE